MCLLNQVGQKQQALNTSVDESSKDNEYVKQRLLGIIESEGADSVNSDDRSSIQDGANKS